MAPRLAIVIPALGPIDALENSLVSVLERRPPGAEVIVALGSPYADPYELAGEVQFVRAPSAAGLAELVNVGVAAATAEIVQVLLSGCEVTDGWTSAIAHFDDPRIAAVIPRIAAIEDREQTLSNGIELLPGGVRRLHRESSPTGEELMKGVWGPTLIAGFFRRAALQGVGGVSTAAGDDFADALLAAALHRGGELVAWAPNSLVLATPATTESRTGKLARAWQSQRLWTLTRDVLPAGRSLAALLKVILRESLGSLPWPSALGQPAMRLAAALLAPRRRPPLADPRLAATPAKPIQKATIRHPDRQAA